MHDKINLTMKQKNISESDLHSKFSYQGLSNSPEREGGMINKKKLDDEESDVDGRTEQQFLSALGSLKKDKKYSNIEVSDYATVRRSLARKNKPEVIDPKLLTASQIAAHKIDHVQLNTKLTTKIKDIKSI